MLSKVKLPFPLLPAIGLCLVIFALYTIYVSSGGLPTYNTAQCGQTVVRTEFPSSRLKDIYLKQSIGRRNAMKIVLDTKDNGTGLFYNVLVPEVMCAELVRIGTIDDGGKWMCSPEEMPNNCTILSLGLNNAISWDEELQQLTEKRCRIVGYDKDKQNQEIQKKYKEVNGKTNVGYISKDDGPDKRLSMENIMLENNINKVEILKMDLEEAEFEVILPFLSKYIVAQILIEIHPLQAEYQPATYKFVQLLSQLNSLGYLIANYEINGHHHILSEFTLLHRSALKRYNAYVLAEYMNI